MKECIRCKSVLDESFFYKDSKYKSGRMSTCKNCIKEDRKKSYRKSSDQIKARVADYRARNLEKVRMSDKKYRQSSKGIQKRKENYAKNIEKHRERDRRRSVDDWFKRKISKIKSKCKAQGLEFDLTAEWLEAQFELQQGRCYWTGVEMDHSNKLFRPSVDRIVPGSGYTKDNVVLTTYFCNIGRGNASSDDMIAMVKALKEDWFHNE